MEAHLFRFRGCRVAAGSYSEAVNFQLTDARLLEDLPYSIKLTPILYAARKSSSLGLVFTNTRITL